MQLVVTADYTWSQVVVYTVIAFTGRRPGALVLACIITIGLILSCCCLHKVRRALSASHPRYRVLALPSGASVTVPYGSHVR